MDATAIRKRLAAATPGVWQVRVFRRPGYCAVVETADPWDDAGMRTLASFERDEDAVLFLEAPTDIAALLAALDEAESMLSIAVYAADKGETMDEHVCAPGIAPAFIWRERREAYTRMRQALGHERHFRLSAIGAALAGGTP